MQHFIRTEGARHGPFSEQATFALLVCFLTPLSDNMAGLGDYGINPSLTISLSPHTRSFSEGVWPTIPEAGQRNKREKNKKEVQEIRVHIYFCVCVCVRACVVACAETRNRHWAVL